ncbi:MAG: helix-turn-helix transcriptional regulator [Lachnospiraceae bacterium]|nr:helix-turn-helix transcriptional regulator [Lachnospiraceae bacterium]
MTFGQTLKQLLSISGVKSAALAARLGYDTSYISRWMSDIKLPSLKNNSRLLSQISQIILEESDIAARERLRQTYCQDGSDSQLEKAIEDILQLAFGRSLPAAQQQPAANRNAIYLPDGMYKNGYGIYVNAIIQYAQEAGTSEIPCISAAPLKTYNNRDTAFWNTILSAPQILDKLHITMHQLVDSSDFSANADSYCAAMCTFSHYRKGVQYEFYEYKAAADLHSVQFTLIADKLLCQNLVNPFTGTVESVLCNDASSLSDLWFSICKQLQLLPKLLSRLSCSTRQFHHYLYDYVMGGSLCYLLNIMHPICITDEFAETLIQQYVPRLQQEERSFCTYYNNLCSRAVKEVVIFRSALLEYIYSGTFLFCGTLIKVGREHRVRHLKQLLEHIKQQDFKLTILSDINPLLNYCDMELSLYLSKTSGFMAPSDSSNNQVIQLRSPLAVEHFHQFFCHLQELDASFVMNGQEAYHFIERGLDFI